MMTVVFCSACVLMIICVSVYEKSTAFSVIDEKEPFQCDFTFQHAP